MSTEKKERKMTAKGFLNKAAKQGAKSAEGFIAQHREWLLTGTLAQFTAPILAQLDAKEVYPTPALQSISAVVLGHMLAENIASADTSQKGEPATKPIKEPREEKAWIACIFNAAGEIQTRKNENTGDDITLRQGFDSSSDADRWCDRRLFDGAPDWFGTVVSTKMFGKDGQPISNVILREDAIARILKKPLAPAMRKTGGSTNKLSFGMKAAVSSRASFSHG